ncbi:unnamed protein product, partial [Mesorhabditis belari]|uniref:Uncharacterized protein n=1 Tax=Mesorhabditis belari TaxID=2138241 RepID=A0AAF3EEB1_9BILA
MSRRRDEPHRALEHFEEFHSTLIAPSDDDLREPIERLIKLFKSSLFSALVEIQDLTEDVLLSDRVARPQKVIEVRRIAELWEKSAPFPSSKLRPTTPTPARYSVSLTNSESYPEATITKNSHDSGLHSKSASQQELNFHIDETGRAWEFEEITLDQSRVGLGFSFSGGDDVASARSIYVTQVLRGGAAYEDGRLKQNDLIVQVNNVDFSKASHHEAKEALKGAGTIVKLIVKRRRFDRDEPMPEFRDTRSQSFTTLPDPVPLAKNNQTISTPSLPPPPPPARSQQYPINEPPIIKPYYGGVRVEIYKGSGGLGFSISGGVGNEQTPTDAGIFITRVIPGGVADLDGRIKVGDKIAAVDNISLENVTHNFALDVLRSTGIKVVLWIVNNPIPEVTAALIGGETPATPQVPPRTFGGSQTALNQTTPTSQNGSFGAPPIPLYPRNVQLVRGAHGLGFNIIGGEDGEPIYISNVHGGGVADQSGNVFKGDVLLKVNGIDVEHASHQEAAEVLRNAKNPILLVLQNRTQECTQLEKKLSDLTVKEWYVRTMFEFDPEREVGIPQRCMPFKYGDILHIINSADDNWWTAKKVADNGDEGPEGVIPSVHRIEKKEKQRRRSVNFNQSPAPFQRGMDGRRGSKTQLSFSRKFPFVKSTDKIHELAEQEASTSDDPIPTYQTVEKESLAYVRPVIVMGALSQKLNDELVNRYPTRFSSCVPHTSRGQQEGEINGKDYYFVSKTQMEQDVKNNLFIEAGTYKENLYGTSIQAIRDVMSTNRHCLLDVGHVAIDRLQRIANIQPITIFIKPSSYQTIYEWDYGNISEDEAMDIFERCQRLEQHAATKFNYIIPNAETTDQILEQIIYFVQRESLPTAWISKAQ